MANFFRLVTIIFCLAIVLFFALKPNPEVPHGMVPDQVRIYLNSHDALRNQLAFGLFGIAVLFSLMTKGFFNRRQIWAISLIALLIPTLEIAQMYMPERHVDIADVLNGWLGLGLACVLYAIVRWLPQIAFSRRQKNRLATQAPRR